MSDLDSRFESYFDLRLPVSPARRRLGGTWQQRDWRIKVLLSLAHQLDQSVPAPRDQGVREEA